LFPRTDAAFGYNRDIGFQSILFYRHEISQLSFEVHKDTYWYEVAGANFGGFRFHISGIFIFCRKPQQNVGGKS
jgi:hypothetical protein